MSIEKTTTFEESAEQLERDLERHEVLSAPLSSDLRRTSGIDSRMVTNTGAKTIGQMLRHVQKNFSSWEDEFPVGR